MQTKIYVGQSALRLTLNCQNKDNDLDISSATTCRIYYTKPSGTSSYWTATLSGTEEMYYDVTGTDILDEAGAWRFWAYAVVTGGVVYGEPVWKKIYSPGE